MGGPSAATNPGELTDGGNGTGHAHPEVGRPAQARIECGQSRARRLEPGSGQ